MRIERFEGVGDFLARAGGWLAEREAEHNLIFGVTATVAEVPGAFGDDPPYLVVVSDPGGRTVAAAIRTPPWRLVLSEVDDLAALPVLADHVASTYPDLPGMVGPVEHVGELARLVGERLGRPAAKGLSERIFRLTTVRRPRPVPGRARLAGPADRDLVIAWYIDFEREALDEPRPDAGQEARIDHMLAGRGSRRCWLWDNDGPVSLASTGGLTPNGIRVGPVYTPPALRNRGYASACVAAASQAALDGGRTFVFLFTDLANPTSNHIYQDIGYEPVRDIDSWRFEV